MDFIPLDNAFTREVVRNQRFQQQKIRVNTIFQNLIQNANKRSFPPPLMTFMNSFMTEGGFLPYDFFSEFELDMLEFDSSDAL